MSHEASRHPIAEVAFGLALAGAAAAGTIAVVSNDLNIEQNKVAITTDQAQPSDALAQAFEAAVVAGTALGAYAIGKRGLHHVKHAINPETSAIDQMAHAKAGRKNGLGRTILGGSLIVVGAGAMIGNFVDTAQEVSTSQSNVADYFKTILGDPKPGQDNFIVSNSPKPELVNNNSISITKASNFITAAKANNIAAIPASWEWHTGQRAGQPEAKIQLLTAGLPAEKTGLPLADQKCDDVSVIAAKELGVAPGETFTMDGMNLTVREVLDSKSGLNLLPVLFNNEDFARCVRNNPDQLFTSVLAQGNKEQITKLLTDQGLSADNLADRAYVVPTSEFVSNSKETGQNSVDPLVLQALAVGAIITGAALGNRASRRLSENRRSNIMLQANGFSRRQINKKEVEVAESEALISALWATPVIILADAVTNSGIPGAELGPSVKTILCVVGLTWGVNRLGTAVAMRREAGKENLVKGQNL